MQYSANQIILYQHSKKAATTHCEGKMRRADRCLDPCHSQRSGSLRLHLTRCKLEYGWLASALAEFSWSQLELGNLLTLERKKINTPSKTSARYEFNARSAISITNVAPSKAQYSCDLEASSLLSRARKSLKTWLGLVCLREYHAGR